VKARWHDVFGAGLVAAAICAASVPAFAGDGDATAVLAFATRYEHAEGVPRDYERALHLYCDAWRLGNAEAAFSIGWMFLNGRGVPRNDAVAVAWFRLGAKEGSLQAARLLGLLSDVEPARTEGCRGSMTRPREVLAPKAIAVLAEKIGAQYKVDPKLILAVIATESAFEIDAVSPRNAQGLMQLIEDTARRFGVRDVFEPADNIRGGTKYLKWLLARFKGDLSLALAAYYAGERAVERHGGVPQYAMSYLERVLSHY
jgi:soluble lytic murein transglycosylase-like protein